MSLADELNKVNQTNKALEDSKVEVDYPSKHLHNYPINFGKKNPTLHVRILPQINPQAPTWAGFRELWVRDESNNSFRSYTLEEDRDSQTDPLMMAVNRWSKVTIGTDNKGNKRNGLYKLDSKYGSYPALKYYVNVVPLDIYTDSQGIPRYKERYTKDGKLDVYMLALSFGLLSSLSTHLQDPMLNPNLIHKQELQQYISKGYKFNGNDLKVQSFISEAFAYPVTLTYTKPANSTATRSLSVDSSDAHILAPLPLGWQSQAEDLVYQTTPSYKYNEHWVSVLINKIDAELGLTSHVEAPKQATDPFPEKKVQATTPTSQPNTNSTVKGGVPNTINGVEYGTDDVYQVGTILPDFSDDDTSKDDGFTTATGTTMTPEQQANAQQITPNATDTQPTDTIAHIAPQPTGLTSRVDVPIQRPTTPASQPNNAVDSAFPDLNNIMNNSTPASQTTPVEQPQTTPTTPELTSEGTQSPAAVSDEEVENMLKDFDIEGME